MARSAKKRRGNGARPSEDKVLTIKAIMDIPDDARPVYVNYAEISHSHNEFGIAFTHLPSKPSPAAMKAAQETGEVHLEPMVYLVVPPTLIPGLIDALTKQRDSYEQKFAKIYVTGDKK